ncbi:hypothetical protein BGX23_002329 [Mortierella sp. AD031]|nr:hypothetical protein BGX23_002329 [Mortierella sp. AD031]
MSVKDPRLSQILPVIRCSDCGHDVEFRLLGEHVCSSAPPMPALPVIPVSKSLNSQPPRTPSRNESPGSGMSSGAYRPGHKPPPIPISAGSPGSNHYVGGGSSSSLTNGSPISPGRPSTASPRPSLPFLEKYAKKKTATTAPSPPPVNGRDANNNNNITGSPLSVSPTTPTAPSYDRQVLSNGMNSHYQREQNDYFPKTPIDDRFGLQQQQQQQPTRSRTPMDDGRYGASPSPIPGRSKTPVMDSSSQFSTSPNSMRASQQPALPQKSNARSPSIASATGLGINGLDSNGRIKSPTGGNPYQDPRQEHGRDRERERERGGSRQQQYSDYADSPPSMSNGFSRSGSSGSAASSVLTERSMQRERSNTVLSERSERSVRSNRSERSDKDRSRHPEQEDYERNSNRDRERERERGERGDRGDRGERERERERERGVRSRADPSSAYKTPSPPISPEDIRSSDAMNSAAPKPSPYRPPTPPDASPIPSRGRRPSEAPARKASGDQFDALMDDLIQEINVLPTGERSGRDSSRPASSHRSRSRPNMRESDMERGSRVRDLAGSPPPTPGLPKLASGSESIRSHRSGKERSERDRERGDRADRERERERERGDRGDREREHRSDRDRSDRTDRDRERSDRGHRSERGTEERGSDRSARERERSDRTTSSRSATRSRSTNRRGGVQHCEGCKHDIQPQEVADVIKMAHGDYHPECFKCARCRRPLESARDGREYEGRLLCEKDYQRYLEKDAQRSERPSRSHRNTPNCAGCEGPIQNGETPVYALGQSWHEYHLACHHCKKPIQQAVGHVEKNGRVYCPKDFGELFLPKCRACNLPVEKEAVCAQDGKLQGKWHAACFGCHTCNKPFPDKSFYVYGDAPYCRRHYHKLNNSLCKGCQEPIEGPCAQTMEGWRFHPGCFCCVECKVALTDVYYNFENQAYCEKDIMVIQRTRNVRAERRKTFFGKV